MPLDIVGDTIVVYAHIPKVAGTSLKTHFNFEKSCHLTMQEMYEKYALRDEAAPIVSTPTDDEKAEGKSVWVPHHRRIVQQKEKKICDIMAAMYTAGYPNKWSFAFKLGFVRNPWDRAGSIYHYHQKDFGWRNFAQFITEMKEGEGIFDKKEESVLKLTQSDYLKVENQFDLNFLGKYESLNADVMRLQEILGVESRPLETSERRSANFRNYTALYENFESVYTVFDYYHEDLVNFGYTFDNTLSCKATKECIRRYKVKDAAQSL